MIIGCLGFGYFYCNLPNVIFNKSLDKVYKSALSEDKDMKTISLQYELNTNIELSNSEDNEIFNIINAISLNGKVNVDLENEFAFVNLDTKYDNKELINADFYMKDNKGYVLLHDIYDKYISVDIEETKEITFDKESYEIVSKEIIEAVKGSLKKEYFTKEKAEIKVNDKSVTATKNILTINNDNKKEIMNSIVNYLKESEEYLDNMAEISNKTEDELITELDEMLKDEEEKEDYELEVSIYTSGLLNKVVSFDLSVNENNDEMLSMTYIDNEIVIKALGEDGSNGEIKITKKDEKTTINFIVETIEGKVGFDLSYSLKYNEELKPLVINNSVNINEFTEEDSNSILTKLMENEGFIAIMTAIEKISSE